jgi:hypothetical protein
MWTKYVQICPRWQTRESKTGQPSLNRYHGSKSNLIKNLRAGLDQNKVERPKLDICNTKMTENALNPKKNSKKNPPPLYLS